MKSILLASASIVAFAGAAAAEVTFSGDAELGYNDTDSYRPVDDEGSDDGFFWSANVAVTMSTALDNGLTASATFDFDVADNSLGEMLESGGYVLSLTSESAGLYFGDTEFAAATHWTGVDGTEASDFSEVDGETVIRGDITYGGIAASVSYAVDDANDEVEQLSVGAAGAFGNFTFAVGYQEETAFVSDGINGDEIFGVTVGTTFGGATVAFEYSQNSTADFDSIGVGVSYPFGPVTVGAYYAMQDAGDGDAYGISVDYVSGPISVAAYFDDTENADEDWGIDAAYSVGNGITAQAGVVDAGEDFYVAGLMDLGSGATLGLSYAEDGDADADDDIGGPEYKDGTTVWVSFAF